MERNIYDCDLEQIVKRCVMWAQDRDIINQSTIEAQLIKLEEEFNELKEAVAEDNFDKIADAIGDMIVVLSVVSEIAGKKYDPESYTEEGEDTLDDFDQTESFLTEFTRGAYLEIKDRRGRMIDGIFVKEADLGEF
jgi:hypothetical protein